MGIIGLMTVGLNVPPEETICFLIFGSSLLISNLVFGGKLEIVLRCGENGSGLESDHGSELLGVLIRSKSSSKPLST